MYIWEQPDWPDFRWDNEALSGILKKVYHERGMLLGRMQALGFPVRQSASLAVLTQEIGKSAEIEGEILNLAAVRSSLGRRLGVDTGAAVPSDPATEAMVALVADAVQNYKNPMTAARLFSWHNALFPAGKSGLVQLQTGAWRRVERDPMQVVSGPVARETVHFEAPPAARLDAEMQQFLTWLDSSDSTDELLRAALAHLWFVTIHPFEDGNGRIGRAILEMLMARAEQSALRFFSLSHQIENERLAYYRILEKTQSGTLDVQEYLEWFLSCLLRAFTSSREILGGVLYRATFWERFATEALNDRQIEMIDRFLGDFQGKLTTSKWAQLTGASQDTAHRDVLDLIERGIMVMNPGGGRSTSYSLVKL